MLEINVSTLFVCRKITIGRKDLFFPEQGLSRAIVLLHSASYSGASSCILCCYWTTPLTWPSHLSAQPQPPPLPSQQGRTRPQPKGSRNTSVHKQTLTWSLARKAFTLICNDNVVEPTNVCCVFSEIPKIPRMKKNTERARERGGGLAIFQAFPLAILRLNRRQTGFTPNDRAHERADTHQLMPRWLRNCIRCFGEAGSACLYNELWEGGRVTARCLAFDPLPAGAVADLEFGTCKSCSAQRVRPPVLGS